MQLLEIATSDDVQENTLFAAKAGGKSVLLTRFDGKVCAFANKCPHLGLPLAKGRLEQGVITCPFHGSSFNVCSGENQDWCNKIAGATLPAWSQKLVSLGKKPAALHIFEAEEKDGKILVKLP